jgi:hypothetical protein
MKLSSLLAWPIPELRARTWPQLWAIWTNCLPYSVNIIYVHAVLLLCGCSVIFNLCLRLFDTTFAATLVGLPLGVLIPSNLYFYLVFKDRRAQVRQFVEEHPDEFNRG